MKNIVPLLQLILLVVILIICALLTKLVVNSDIPLWLKIFILG